MDDLSIATALIIVQQKEISRLKKSANYYKNELKMSRKHCLKIKENC
jgi:hypothetical protein